MTLWLLKEIVSHALNSPPLPSTVPQTLLMLYIWESAPPGVSVKLHIKVTSMSRYTVSQFEFLAEISQYETKTCHVLTSSLEATNTSITCEYAASISTQDISIVVNRSRDSHPAILFKPQVKLT